MGQENVDEFGAARKGEAVLRQWMRENGEDLRHVTGASVADAFGSLAPPVDRAVLNGGYADALAAVFRRSLAPGFDGWIDDDLAFTRDWGFDLRDIHAPVAVWQGEPTRWFPSRTGAGWWLMSPVRRPGWCPATAISRWWCATATRCSTSCWRTCAGRRTASGP